MKQLRPIYMKHGGIYGYYRQGYFFNSIEQVEYEKVEDHELLLEEEKIGLSEGVDYEK